MNFPANFISLISFILGACERGFGLIIKSYFSKSQAALSMIGESYDEK